MLRDFAVAFMVLTPSILVGFLLGEAVQSWMRKHDS
jgi:hypothetical protein